MSGKNDCLNSGETDEGSPVGKKDEKEVELLRQAIALCAESEVRKAVERSSYAVALKFRVFFCF